MCKAEHTTAPLAVAALNALRNTLTQPVIARLCRALDSDPDENFLAEEFLGRLSVTNADALAAILRARESKSIRARTAFALSYADHRDPRVIKSLTDSLGDADAKLRCASAWSLAAHCNLVTLPSLMRALNDSDPRVQLIAAVGLAHLGQVTEPVISVLIRGYKNLNYQGWLAIPLVESVELMIKCWRRYCGNSTAILTHRRLQFVSGGSDALRTRFWPGS